MNLRRIIPALAFPFAAIALQAQTANPPDSPPPTTSTTAPATTAPATAPTNEESVKLSPFEVSESAIHGYQASETMLGTRVNTPIIDLPYSTVNLTQQFFHDFGITILDENLTYIGGFTGLSIGGSFILRGFSSTSQLRDGFYRLGRYGSSNVATLEIIRGSEAGIYGRASPGGMVNMVSLAPAKEDTQTLNLMEGGYSQSQVELQATGSLDKAQKWYYVVSLDKTGRRYDGQYEILRNDEDFIAIKHDFSDTSHLQVQAEYFLNIQHAGGQVAAPLLSDTRTPDVNPTPAIPNPALNLATTKAIGLDTALAKYNAYGPDEFVNRGEVFYTAEYDKEFNDIFSMRLAANDFRARAWSYANIGWGAVVLPANVLFGGAVTDTRGSATAGATPEQYGRIMEDGGGSQSDFVAHYGLFKDAVDNKTLFTVDFNDYYRWDPTLNYSYPNTPVNAAWVSGGNKVPLTPIVINGVTEYIPSGPITYWQQPQSTIFPSNFTVSTLTRRRTTQLGGNLSQQMFLLDKRLILFGGLRNDNVRFVQSDYTVAFATVGYENVPPRTIGSQVRRYFHENKPNAGFNYAIINHANGDGFHLYGSFSESYFVDQTSRPAVIASTGFQPQVAKGEDYGVKGIFFNGNLSFTLGGFYAEQFNVAASEEELQPDGSFKAATVNQGNQTDKGFEGDLNWQATPDLSFVGSIGTVDARYSNFGNQFPEVVGRHVQNVAPCNGSIAATYNFSHGLFKGLQLGVLASYVGPINNQSPSAGDTTAVLNGVYVVTGHTNAWRIQIPSQVNWVFQAHYTLPNLRHGYDQTLGFIVNNPFNRTEYLKTSGNYADERNIEITYTLTHSGHAW